MLKRGFEDPRNVIRVGMACTSFAVVFTFVGRRWLSSVMSPDAFDALAGLFHGVAFGLLGLGTWRLARGRTGDRSGRRL